ncbi:hypothetical protein OG196_01095 [Kitasatospora purpeofusca]|nr:hypothetical protein OG715_00530 [Kitasatospora purpeofusca]WSR45831.1 hypothetical protein OG196_01095 [Kitasatospora purpeofusca]
MRISHADFEQFFSERFAAAVQEAGLAGEPGARFTTLHRRFVAAGVSGAA